MQRIALIYNRLLALDFVKILSAVYLPLLVKKTLPVKTEQGE
jgi:hypothetical protein